MCKAGGSSQFWVAGDDKTDADALAAITLCYDEDLARELND
jgi:hypothetical protein